MDIPKHVIKIPSLTQKILKYFIQTYNFIHYDFSNNHHLNYPIISSLKNIFTLDLSGCNQVTASCLQVLAKIKTLQKLDISKCKHITIYDCIIVKDIPTLIFSRGFNNPSFEYPNMNNDDLFKVLPKLNNDNIGIHLQFHVRSLIQILRQFVEILDIYRDNFTSIYVHNVSLSYSPYFRLKTEHIKVQYSVNLKDSLEFPNYSGCV